MANRVPDLDPDLNPFALVCDKCHRRISVHQIRGRKAFCHPFMEGSFRLWEIVAVKRALGHKITNAMSYAAAKDRAEARVLGSGS